MNTMKRILTLALGVLLVAAPFASAQLKGSADQKKYVEAAQIKSELPKYAVKAATWSKLGEAYFKSYTDVTGGIQIGQDEMNVNFLIQAKPVSTEMIDLGGVQTLKVIYSTVNLYYQNGVVQGVEPTDWAYPDALYQAGEAFKKALELDPKKEKDIVVQFTQLNNRLNQLGITWNLLGDQAKSSKAFEDAYKVSTLGPIDDDFDALYNAGMTAWLDKDYARSRDLYLTAIAAGFDNKGEVYAKLGDIFNSLEDQASRKQYLEEGFAKYPENQSILVGLINYADQADEDPNYVLKLLEQAKINDPNNASIYAVEGNMYAEMKQYDTAVERYHEAVAVDPNYVYAYYAEGSMWYNVAVDIQLASDALPPTAWQEFDRLDKEKMEALAKCIEPLEKCFNGTEDINYKRAAAEILRRVYYSLSNTNADYEAKSEFYKNFVDENPE